jgi:ribosomal protein L37E
MWKPGQIVTIKVKGKPKRFRITRYMGGIVCRRCRNESHEFDHNKCAKCFSLTATSCYPKPLEPKSSIG